MPGPALPHVRIGQSAHPGEAVDMAASATVFAQAKTRFAAVMAKRALAESFATRHIDPELAPKAGSIRDHLAASD